MQNTTPNKIQSLNPLVYSELIRIEKIVDAKVLTDTGSTDIGTLLAPMTLQNSMLWTDNWNLLWLSLDTYLKIDRTVPYQKLMMSIINATMNKLDAALLNSVSMTNLVDFGGLYALSTTFNSSNIKFQNLIDMKVLVDSAWASEQTKINTFSSTVTAQVTNKGIAAALANPQNAAAMQSQGYAGNISQLNTTLPIK